MCGIIGILGEINAFQLLLSGLYQLQNRGYDSAGISVLENGEIVTIKRASTDKESALDMISKSKDNHTKNHVGIAHTRWATHGGKTDINSHPHQSYDDKFTIVHNGIIENFQEIKDMLSLRGIKMRSHTDTEVIVNLIAMYFDEDNDIITAIKRTTAMMKGTWGIAVLYKNDPNKLYCTRHGSPLLIGYDDSTAMVTSEQSGFCNKFNKYIVLNNHDICIIEKHVVTGGVTINTKYIYTEKQALNINNTMTPDPYSHWMIKETHEQVESSLRAISLGGRLTNDDVHLGGLLTKEHELKKLDNIILLGCGTSYNAGMMGAHFLKELSGFNSVQLFDGAEFCEYDIPILGKTGLILISQSGETKDLHRCIKIAQNQDLFTIGIVNVVDSLIAREVDCGCYMNAGREVAVASTKSFTSQVIILSMIAILFSQMKNIHKTKRHHMLTDIRTLHMDIAKTIESNELFIQSNIVPLFNDKYNCFLLGKGKCESIAREGALKIKEVSYIHAEGYSTSSLKHGPFALLVPDFPVILIAPDDEHYTKSLNAYAEITSRLAIVIMITDNDKCDKPNTIKIPYNKTYRELLSIIPLQLLSYELSLSRGLNPDMPRNLAKVVTVE